MKRLGQAWMRYWFTPASLFNLAVARVLIVATELYHLPSDPREKFQGLDALPTALYDPLPVLHVLVAPLGWTYRPGVEMLEAIYWIVVVSGVAALIGLLTNVSLVLFAWGSIFLQSYEYSFGEFHHPEAPMMIALVVLALSPAGAALSLDAWRKRRSGHVEGILRIGDTSPFARWPLLVIQWVLALVYLSAAYHKMRVAGLDWLNGYTLQNYILQDATRWDAAIGLWIGQYYWLILVMSWISFLWESTFFLILLFPALVWIYVPLGIGFHTGTWVTMRAGFYQMVGLYAAAIPWEAVYVRLLRRRKAGSREERAGVVKSDAQMQPERLTQSSSP